jgi:tetratricopeptide (TPR) repeat protein
MKSLEELHHEANNLRQGKKYRDAIPLYEKVWVETGDQYDGAGLLSCLRKSGDIEMAIPLAEELVKKFPDFLWVKHEAIWTLINGKLNMLNENASVDDVLNAANEIMALRPEGVAAKTVVFKVLKSAKTAGKWDIVCEWADKLDPDKLSITPMTDEKGREGWSDQSLWYNYKCKSLIEQGRPEEALQFIDEVIEKYPKQRKFLLRLKALALYKMKRLDEAEECYKDLCGVRKPDWWLLQEYARVINDKGDKKAALKVMCQAANSNAKLDLMVTLFQEMGLLFKELGEADAARAHFALSSLVRQERGWSVSNKISDSIAELNRIIGNADIPASVKDALSLCRKEWENILGISISSQRKPRRGLTGKVQLGSSERPFCFIVGDLNESFFCFKSDLPADIKDGDIVNFNALPSFDRKKNRESWKAVDITKTEH